MLNRETLRTLGPSMFVIFVDTMSRTLTYPILVPLIMLRSAGLFPPGTTIQTRLFYLFIVLSIQPLCKMFGGAFLGNLSDILRRRPTLLLNTIGLATTLYGFGLAIHFRSIIAIIIARCFVGFFSGSKPIAIASLVDLSPKEDRAQTLAFSTFSYSLGMMFGPLLGGLLATSLGYAFPLYCSATLTVTAILWIFFSFKESYVEHKPRHFTWKEIVLPCIRPFLHKRLRYLFPIAFFFDLGTALYQLAIWYFFTNVASKSSFTIGLYMTIGGAISVLTIFFLVPQLTKRYCCEKLMTVGLLLNALPPLALSFLFVHEMIWGLLLPFYLLVQINYTCLYANTSHAVAVHFQGWAMGTITTAVALSWITGSGLSNLIPNVGLSPFILYSAGSLVLAALLLILYRSRFHPNKTEPEIEL